MPRYRKLLFLTLASLLLSAALVALSYFYIDRTVAWFVHDQRLSEWTILKWLTYPPGWLETAAPAVLAALMFRRALGRFRPWERAVLAACIAMILAEQFRDTLSYAFGRYWPETWINDNPSLIGTGAYGFHPWHYGNWYESFPSGHTARSAAIAAVVWIGYPRWRLPALALCLLVVIGLLGMNYHFTGDTAGGAWVGATVGAYTAVGCGVRPAVVLEPLYNRAKDA